MLMGWMMICNGGEQTLGIQGPRRLFLLSAIESLQFVPKKKGPRRW
jgi:hypothetical protein